jgi:CDGSH-type Zn-finger protein
MSLKCLYQTRRVSGNVDVTEVFVPNKESEWQCRCWNKHFSDIYIATHSPGLVQTLQWHLHCYSLSWLGTNTSVTSTLPLTLLVWYKHFSDIYIATHSPGLMSLKCLYQTRRVNGNVDVTEVFVPNQESEWQCRCHWSVCTKPGDIHFSDIYISTHSPGLVQTLQWHLHCYSQESEWQCRCHWSVCSKPGEWVAM